MGKQYGWFATDEMINVRFGPYDTYDEAYLEALNLNFEFYSEDGISAFFGPVYIGPNGAEYNRLPD